MAGPARRRLDEEVVARGLLESRSRARAFILAGDVLVNGEAIRRAGVPVAPADDVTLATPPRFVGRGGEKLAHALQAFGVDATGLVAADLGASTGGFTDCLLQAGATRVFAVDVGYGQLDDRLRRDERVVVMERTNARLLEALPELVDLVVIDVSFISLRLILPVAARLLRPGGRCLPLIKPQFEAGAREVGKGGVVRDPATHRRVLVEVLAAAEALGFRVTGLVRSPLLGPAGNVEFLAGLIKAGDAPGPVPLVREEMIAAVLATGEGDGAGDGASHPTEAATGSPAGR
jgi:23S rRNA (cytidine1920-2'-O)/16S rRNA (cytidine1409-2'-O)-methyltransferase